MINVLIPSKTRCNLPEPVESGINKQVPKVNAVKYCDDSPANGRVHEIKNRMYLNQYATEPYTVLMDDDVILQNENDIEAMCDYLDTHSEYGAVAIDSKGLTDGHLRKLTMKGHVCIGCICVRGCYVKKLYWDNADPSFCLCQCLNLYMDFKGKRTGYLFDRRATEIKFLTKD